VLQRATLLPAARFVVLHCADVLEQTLDGTGQYYESIDLIDASIRKPFLRTVSMASR
jgi:DMSO/TMAO reductase YedYZ molybdopterin-dependent catalytic subunit